MNILQQLTEKPWEAQSGVVTLHGGRSFQALPETIALRVFLVVVAVLFSLLITAYGVRMAYEDWRPAPAQWLLWVNTGLLIASSVALHSALIAMRDGRLDRARTGLAAAGGLAVAFLFGQLLAWRQLDSLPIFDITNPAIAFFYLITGLHALHVAGGLVALGLTTLLVWRSGDMARATRRVKLCTTYWHFLLGVWLLLFGLLFSGNDSMNIILSICGLR